MSLSSFSEGTLQKLVVEILGNNGLSMSKLLLVFSVVLHFTKENSLTQNLTFFPAICLFWLRTVEILKQKILSKFSLGRVGCSFYNTRRTFLVQSPKKIDVYSYFSEKVPTIFSLSRLVCSFHNTSRNLFA